MKDIYGTAIYPKNVGPIERALRLVGSATVAISAWTLAPEPWMKWVGLGTGAMLALTGALGFCPACYFAGRKTAS